MSEALHAHDALQARCRRLVAAVDLSQADTTDDLAAAVAAHLQIPIHLRPFPRGKVADLSGGCLVLGQDVVIAYPDGTDPWYQQVAVGHELGHLLCGHLTGLPIPRTAGGLEDDGLEDGQNGDQDDGQDLLALLLPDLLQAHETWTLFRCAAATAQEREAEMVGSLLVAQLEYHRTPRSREAGRLTGLVSRRPGRIR